jgi:glycine cleavage system H protein
MATPTVLYRRATFVTHLPVDYLYTPAHCWLARAEPAAAGRWRVGYTKFALRMLGEVVDVQWDCAPGQAVQPGDLLGTIEGFKALSDIYCAGRGHFAGGNPALAESLAPVNEQPYDAGWLYEFTGEPPAGALDVQGYRDLLDTTIDHILARQQSAESPQ